MSSVGTSGNDYNDVVEEKEVDATPDTIKKVHLRVQAAHEVAKERRDREARAAIAEDEARDELISSTGSLAAGTADDVTALTAKHEVTLALVEELLEKVRLGQEDIIALSTRVEGLRGRIQADAKEYQSKHSSLQKFMQTDPADLSAWAVVSGHYITERDAGGYCAALKKVLEVFKTTVAILADISSFSESATGKSVLDFARMILLGDASNPQMYIEMLRMAAAQLTDLAVSQGVIESDVVPELVMAALLREHGARVDELCRAKPWQMIRRYLWRGYWVTFFEAAESAPGLQRFARDRATMRSRPDQEADLQQAHLLWDRSFDTKESKNQLGAGKYAPDTIDQRLPTQFRQAIKSITKVSTALTALNGNTDAADKSKKVAAAREWCANMANVANQS